MELYDRSKPRLFKVYRVEFYSREVPKCFKRLAIQEFSNSETVIWVRTRKQRNDLLACDRSATWAAHEYRQCKICGRKMLGLQAQIRIQQEDQAKCTRTQVQPCSQMCA